MIQLVDVLPNKRQFNYDTILEVGKEITVCLGNRKISGIISYFDCTWQQERRLYARPTVDINISLIDVKCKEEGTML